MPKTMLSNLVNPEVMADAVRAKLPKKIAFSSLAKIDDTLVGQPGDTVTVPKFAYIGDAEDVAEGVAMGTSILSATTTKAKVKKAAKALEISDEGVLSGYGDPQGEGESQLALAIAAKIDNDCYDTLSTASMKYDGTAGKISYAGVVGAIDLYQDESEIPVEKIIFVHPNQQTTLRLDPDFLDINKYPSPVMMTGVIGSIAGCQVKPSKKVKLVKYEKDNATGTITIVDDETVEDATNKHLSTIMANTLDLTLAVGDKVKAVATEYYANPIVVRDVRDPNTDSSADGFDEEAPALTIYRKRDIMLEADRDILAGSTVVAANQHYTSVLSNDSKVVLAKFKV